MSTAFWMFAGAICVFLVVLTVMDHYRWRDKE
jgi:hypothetical protein